MTFANQTYTRTETVDDIGPWTWIIDETGAWNGPKHDWELSHMTKYLQYLKGRKMVVCAGGNQGMYPRLFGRLFETVYTFEPDPLNFYCLVNNCQSENIIKINAALGDEATTVQMKIQVENNRGMNQVIPQMGNIPQLKLDSFHLNHLDLLQLDVEGYELNVLKGAEEHIKKFKPVIACERGGNDIENFLFPIGYSKADQSFADVIYKID